MNNRAHNETEPILKAGVDVGSPVQVKDDHDQVRTGLARLLAADAQLRLVTRAEIGLDAVEPMLRPTPDAVLVDGWVPTRADHYPETPSEPEPPRSKVLFRATRLG